MRWYQRLKATRALSSSDPERRVDAVKRLAEIGDMRSVQAISDVLLDKDAVVRSYAADSLIDLCCYDVLRQALDHASPHVRAEAAEALGDLGDPRACEGLIGHLSDPAMIVRSTTAYALGELGGLQAVEPLISLLSDPEPAVRRHATYALGNLGDPRAIEFLMESLADSDPEVCAAASDAMHKLEGSRTN
ncbi:MAG: HEAT repeat protein [Bradymonadia bacterium]